MSQFGSAVAGQAHHRNRAGPQEREQRHRELAAVRQLQEHPIADSDAQLSKSRRGTVGAFVQLREGQPPGPSASTTAT